MRDFRHILVLVIAIFGANICCAQITDPLNQNKKVHGEWSTEAEEVISKKKNNDSKEDNKPIIDNTVQSQPQAQVKINNSCPEDLTVEFISLVGNSSSQEVTLTIRFTNHRVNEYIYIRNFLAFNQEGDEFSSYTIGGYNTLTDVAQKTSWRVGQMLPSKNMKLTALSFNIGGCTVEMRNIPIDWK